MKIEHLAIWTKQLENLKDYYTKYYDGTANDGYFNPKKNFRSYFIAFSSGARLEIMSKTGIPENKNAVAGEQHLGLIHFAFEAGSMQAVDAKAIELQGAGFEILSGPRKTGDGYYEFETLDPDNNRIEVTTKYND